MRSHRMRGYGAWCQGWRDAERLPPGPPGKPGAIFWCFVIFVLISCVKAAIDGHPIAILVGLGVLVGAIKGSS